MVPDGRFGEALEALHQALSEASCICDGATLATVWLCCERCPWRRAAAEDGAIARPLPDEACVATPRTSSLARRGDPR